MTELSICPQWSVDAFPPRLNDNDRITSITKEANELIPSQGHYFSEKYFISSTFLYSVSYSLSYKIYYFNYYCSIKNNHHAKCKRE